MKSQRAHSIKLCNAELEKKLRSIGRELEKKNRELEIEGALEKVRSIALEMTKVADMLEVCRGICEQLELLRIKEIRNVQTAVIHALNGTYINYEYYRLANKTLITEVTDIHPVQAAFISQMLNGPGAFFTTGFTGAEVKEWLEYQKTTNVYIDTFLVDAPSLNYYWYSLGPVALGLSTYAPLSDEDLEIFKRFRNAFELTYRRYLDVEQALAQAREAKIEAALERTRTQSMTMQRSNELDDTLRVFHEQVLHLGIHSAFSFLWLPDEEKDRHIFWAAWAEDSSKVFRSKAVDYPLNRDDAATALCLADWKGYDPVVSYHVPPDGVEGYFAAWQELIDGVDQLKPEYFAGGLYYVEAFMKYGCFGVMVENPLTVDEKTVLGRVAIEFERAYARFLGLQKAEAQAIQAAGDLILLQIEKKRTEEALTELRATQNRLIQKEKMASLGEVTAGIAHEIQNPLNFVNNFSEVNTELIEEKEEEIEKGNLADIKAIANSIKDNQQKISQHGKRADSIVRGMLEHSRATTGEKEPTDINILANEYLRLSFHGLRAKDKSFNSELITHFQTDLPKANVIPQDIGRVLLNLFNNAFYATNQKKLLAEVDFKPEVSVSTSLESGNIIIEVKDNGNGIPDNIREKIMQPFFTTKPTGEGTGLGLSLSYDIVVKGHGGSLTVNIKESFTEFVVSLPLT